MKLMHYLSQITQLASYEEITVKLSGDGAKFSSTSNFVLLSFSFPQCNTEALSGSGNYVKCNFSQA